MRIWDFGAVYEGQKTGWYGDYHLGQRDCKAQIVFNVGAWYWKDL